MSDYLLDRISKKFLVGDGCWPWTGTISPDGYGMITFWDKNGKWTGTTAHRILYQLFVGSIPNGEEIDHICRVRHCVRPDHLRSVPPLQNRVGNYKPNPNILISRTPPKSECKWGHSLITDNVYIRPDGHRECRICKRRLRQESKKRWRR